MKMLIQDSSNNTNISPLDSFITDIAYDTEGFTYDKEIFISRLYQSYMDKFHGLLSVTDKNNKLTFRNTEGATCNVTYQVISDSDNIITVTKVY